MNRIVKGADTKDISYGLRKKKQKYIRVGFKQYDEQSIIRCCSYDENYDVSKNNTEEFIMDTNTGEVICIWQNNKFTYISNDYEIEKSIVTLHRQFEIEDLGTINI